MPVICIGCGTVYGKENEKRRRRRRRGDHGDVWGSWAIERGRETDRHISKQPAVLWTDAAGLSTLLLFLKRKKK
jgi:hypothetical protein